MKKYGIYIALASSCTILLVNSCFPSKKVNFVKSIVATDPVVINTPTKVFMMDSSMVLLNDGFIINEEILEGTGQRYWINRTGNEQLHRIHLDSIATMAYYEMGQSIRMGIGAATMILTGIVLTPLSIHCIICPKCCFGSCPTVYTAIGNEFSLEAELFSYSLSKFYQETDIDRLDQGLEANGTYRLRLTNEALETHYINQFNLMAIRHSEGTEVYPTPDNNIVSVGDLSTPGAAINSLGKDVLALIEKKDDLWHLGDSTRIHTIQDVSGRDWLDLSIQVPENAAKVKLVLRIRNTLLSTVLFYDVVLASQGVKALEWIERLNTDSVYATFYQMVYSSFAGMDVSLMRDGIWERAGQFGDVGPIAWKELGLELPAVIDEEGKMQVRLEWFPDNFMIDYIGYEVTVENDEEPISVDMVKPTAITNYLGEDATGIWSDIEKDDSDFLVTYPGDFYHFEYEVPHLEDASTTLFLKSKGYYTEWLRGDWISHKESGYQFNLFEVDETFEQLKSSWTENRSLMEKSFFETRIPLKEGL